MKFINDRVGFGKIITEMEARSKKIRFKKVIIGLEAMCHYWKAVTHYVVQRGIMVLLANPYHTKRTKELDNNSQTKSDKKDALTIAKLVKDDRYSEMYLLQDIYSELRALGNTRNSLMKRRRLRKQLGIRRRRS